MKYREQLLELIFAQDEDAMLEWLEAQDPLDQAEILRELKLLAEEAAQDSGDNIEQFTEGFDTIINDYEEAVLDEKLAEAQYIMALEEQEKAVQEMEEATMKIRSHIKECILTNAPNAEEMRGLAEQMMALEKENGIYDPENWKEIF